MSRLAIVTCYFNPCNYEALRKNYVRFCAEQASADFFSLEVYWPGQAVLGLGQTIQASAENFVWQKERLLNLLVARLPAEFDRVAWVDADIEFANKSWKSDVLAALDQHPVVQCFDTVDLPDEKGAASTMRSAAARHDTSTLTSHCGFAWAARREVFPLYDKHLVGAGDVLNMLAFYGDFDHYQTRYLPIAFRRDFLLHALPVWDKVRGNVGCVPGRLRHWFHGKKANRAYQSRNDLLRDLRFDPYVDLTTSANGLLEVRRAELLAAVRGYFEARQEDG